MVGHSAIAPGENRDVAVTIDAAGATPTLFAMLHVDRGELDTYEFPGDDGPVTLGGQVVTPAFQVTNLEETASESPVEMLPQSGGAPSPWPLVLLAAGLLVLAGGLSLSLARRTR